ncbi:MAG: ABC transporter permease [Halobacteria archaeon]
MSMAKYVLKRLVWAAFATFLIISVTFVLLELSPDTGQARFAFQQAQAGGDVEQARQTYQQLHGASGSLLDRYVDYVTNAVTLNWGWSETRNQPVIEAVSEAWVYSAMYGIPAIILAVVLGFGVGLYSATHRYTRTDYVATFFAFFGVSVPNFWLAVMLILVFSVQLGVLPTYFSTEVGVFTLQNLKQLILPVLVVSTTAVAAQMRYSRAEAMEYVNSDFVKMARAKGAGEKRVLGKHIFRPALVPLSTILVGDLLGIVFVSSYVTEVIFQIPGLGLLSYEAIIQQDTPLVLATTLIPVAITLIGNLLQDVLYPIIDPRISYEENDG